MMKRVGGIVKLTVFVLALIETFTGSVIDCVICTLTFSSADQVSTDQTSSFYYVTSYLLPNKHFCKVIIVLYVPILYLWRSRRNRKHKFVGGQSSAVQVLPSTKLENLTTTAFAGHRVTFPLRHLIPVEWNLAHFQLFHPSVRTASSPGRVMDCLMKHEQELDSDKQTPVSTDVATICNVDGLENVRHHAWIAAENRQKDVINDSDNAALLTTFTKQYADYSWAIQTQYNTKSGFYWKLPWKTVSRCYGAIHGLTLPICLRTPCLRFFIWIFGVSLDDAAVTDLRQYRNVAEFFLRSLKPGIRPIARTYQLTSPVDGGIVHCGPVTGNGLEQIKGVTYSLPGFLGPVDDFLLSAASRHLFLSPLDDTFDTDVGNGFYDEAYYRSLLTCPGNVLHQCVIYLSPGDYHHFHSPADWVVTARRHFPGELLTVNPSIVRWCRGLFNFNERAVYVGRWRHGFFSMTAVGATLVGSINVYFDKTLTTNNINERPDDPHSDVFFTTRRRRGVRLSKGQPMGEFRLGSTIILLFEAPPDFRFTIGAGHKVRYGCGISAGKTHRRNQRQRQKHNRK